MNIAGILLIAIAVTTPRAHQQQTHNRHQFPLITGNCIRHLRPPQKVRFISGVTPGTNSC